MIGFELEVAPDLQRALDDERKRMQSAAHGAMRMTMVLAEQLAKAQHETLSGWKNESGMLEATITGYVVGDPRDEVYHNQAAAQSLRPRAPFKRGNRVVRSQRYLDEHYRIMRSVSPPVRQEKGRVVGILHHYMKYSNRLPFATGEPDIAVAALEANRGQLEQALGDWLVRLL